MTNTRWSTNWCRLCTTTSTPRRQLKGDSSTSFFKLASTLYVHRKERPVNKCVFIFAFHPTHKVFSLIPVRPKCSVSSVLVAPGPCGHAVQRLDEREIRKEEEQHQTVDGHEGSDSAHTLTIGLVPSSTPLTPRERKSYTHSDRSKHKSLARKRPCRQNSLTSCSQKAEQAQISESRMETAPSRGECFASIPSRVPQVNEVDRTATQDVKNSSTSRFHNVNVQKEGSLRCLNVITNQQEDKKPDSSEWEVVQDGNAPVDKMTVNNLSERREESLSSHSFSPVRKIQRRVRVYKRKRRKADTCVKSVKSSDIPDNSMIKLGAFSAN